ncbi:MAG TPA: tetratricopeptide repeat protein [Bryobacteraceae bacterium]|nr:tetratricopeptide repeat protein [Bryobacteraceae bacterium]
MTASTGGTAPAAGYRRADVLRMVDVTEKQLRAWERQGLVPAADTFGFSGLLALKTLKRLRESNIKPAQIRQAMEALKERLENVDFPLTQLRITAEGRRIAVHVAGNRMDPLSGQLLLDFDAKEIEKLRTLPPKEERAAKESDRDREAREREAEDYFQRGLTLEETGAPLDDAVAAYQKAIELNPNASGALVNLGTIAFRRHRLKEAALLYNRALEADPTYPLAHFNLGNLYEEQADFGSARRHYLEALRLNPRYADAQFNLALLCERTGDLLQAIGYWQSYLRLDATSSWASTARKQLDRLKRTVRSK